ncbi:hypothetical protein [Thiopseudomonas acetoxidans]|uniref:Lipoprotein n=1 Tax=Thiopseudomonas acetoxidans TaxID=3041622 RepID=A0ABT7SNY3_9GAMM|nr:hypothetical protein [Thiopseudomonas sp. CY1220]MDM7857704.1 hypothetical protein [Thiopseudomonas sp. CY1220]
MRDVCMLISIVAFLGLSGCSTPEEKEIKEYFYNVHSGLNDIEIPSVFKEAEVVCLMHPYQMKIKLPEHVGIQDSLNLYLESEGVFSVPESSWYLLFMTSKDFFIYRHKRNNIDMVSPTGTVGLRDKWKSIDGYPAKDCVAYEYAYITVFLNDLNERKIGLISKGEPK